MTLRIVTEPQEQIALWLIDRLPDVTDVPGGYWAIGVARDDVLVGGALFTNYRTIKGGGDCEVWCAGTNWLSRRIIREIFSYPFDVLNCNRLTALVRKSNKPSRRLLEGLGFSLEGRHRQAYGLLSHGLSYCLLRDEWAVSRLNNGMI